MAVVSIYHYVYVIEDCKDQVPTTGCQLTAESATKPNYLRLSIAVTCHGVSTEQCSSLLPGLLLHN